MHPIEPGTDGKERIHPEDVAEWREWLAQNHATSPGVWVAYWRKESGRTPMPYEAIVVECLRYGWIDAITKRLDDDRTMQYCAPRKPGSGWARTNKRRIAELEKSGQMESPGAAVIAAAKADGSWSLLDDVEDLIVPADLADAFVQRPGSREHWDAFPPSARKLMLSQIAFAKRPPTRAARIVRIADAAAAGERGYR